MKAYQHELEARAVDGFRPSTITHIESVLSSIGYKLDRSMDCRHVARYLTGPRAGQTHPCISTGIKEIDTGLSFANYTARRDSNFEKLQSLRFSGELFAVVRGAILEI